MKGLIEDDMTRKACLTPKVRSITSGELNKFEVLLINEGDYPARDVLAEWDVGHGFPTEPGRPLYDVIPPDNSNPTKRYSAGFQLPQPKLNEHGDPIPGQEHIVRLRLRFRDGTGKLDTAIYTFIARNDKDSRRMWNLYEDEQAVVISPLCRHIRPPAGIGTPDAAYYPVGPQAIGVDTIALSDLNLDKLV
jgi:hypothetical protein